MNVNHKVMAALRESYDLYCMLSAMSEDEIEVFLKENKYLIDTLILQLQGK